MENEKAEFEWVKGGALITNKLGLHARTAIKLTKLAMKFEAKVEICSEQRPEWVNAKSPNAVVKLRPPKNSPIYVRAAGEDANEAVDSIVYLVNSNFHES